MALMVPLLFLKNNRYYIPEFLQKKHFEGIMITSLLKVEYDVMEKDLSTQEQEVRTLSGDDKEKVILRLQGLTPYILKAIIQKQYYKGRDISFEDVKEICTPLEHFYQSLDELETISHLIEKSEDIRWLITKFTLQLIAAQCITSDSFFSEFKSKAHALMGNALFDVKRAMLNNKSTFPTLNLSELLPDVEDKSIERTLLGIDIFIHLPEDIVEKSTDLKTTIGFFKTATYRVEQKTNFSNQHNYRPSHFQAPRPNNSRSDMAEAFENLMKGFGFSNN